MNKKEKILWLSLIILLLLIISIVTIITLNKEDNSQINIDNNKEDNNYRSQIIDRIWIYYNSYYYDNNNVSSIVSFDDFELEFSDAQVKICFEDGCDTSNYEINGNILTIELIKKFTGSYKISFEENYLLLEYTYDDGSRMVYCFTLPLG